MFADEFAKEEFTKEDIIRRTAPLPLLSAGLRARVLEAAGEACERRSRGRRAVASALLAFGLVGSFTWFRPGSKGQGQAIASDVAPPRDLSEGTSSGEAGAAVPAGEGLSRSERLILAMGDDWKMVEAEFRSREEFTRRVQLKSQM